MGLGVIEHRSGQIAELATSCPDLRSFRERLLDELERAIGFDKGSLHSHRGGAVKDTCIRGYDVPAAFDDLPRYMAELEPPEIAVAGSGRPIVDRDVLPAGRRDRLSLYRCLLRPERVTVFTTVMWRTTEGVSGLSLARTGPGARFRAAEVHTLGALLATIRLADSFVGLRAREARSTSFEAWADRIGLGVKERAVTALVVRGLQTPEIAAVLGVSPHTVRNQLVSVFRKADVSTRAELAYTVSTVASLEGSAAGEPGWAAFVR